jgi:hypothetical protein
VLEQFVIDRLGPPLAEVRCLADEAFDRVVAALVSATLSEDQIIVRLDPIALIPEVMSRQEVSGGDDGACTIRIPFFMRWR